MEEFLRHLTPQNKSNAHACKDTQCGVLKPKPSLQGPGEDFPGRVPPVSYSLNCLKEGSIGDYVGVSIGEYYRAH